MQSGAAKTKAWQLDYEPEQPRVVEPLMGWTSSGDMKQQLTLHFHTKEDAVAYCEREGIPYQVLEPKELQPRVKAYASGLDYHLSDEDYCALFAHAASVGYTAFKIKVGHPDIERDLHRLDLLVKTVGKPQAIMIDANEGWSPQEAVRRLNIINKAGFDILWIEDPCLRFDFEGLKMIRAGCPFTLVNSGEYFDASGKRALMEARGTDMINVHGHVSEVMRIGWLAAEYGIPVSLGNSMLEIGINMAIALPEVEWLEYSFQNFDHLVEQPIEIRDGYAYAPERPGHGLVLSEEARRVHAVPDVMDIAALPPAPFNPRLPR